MEFISDLRPEYDSVPTFPAVITCVTDDDNSDEFGTHSLVADVQFPGHPILDELGIFSVHLCGEKLDRVALCYYELNPGDYDNLPVQSGMKGVFAELVANHKGDLLRLRAKLIRERAQQAKQETIELDHRYYESQLQESMCLLQQMQRLLHFTKPVPEADDPTNATGVELPSCFATEDIVPELVTLTARAHEAVQNVVAHWPYLFAGAATLMAPSARKAAQKGSDSDPRL